MTVDSTQVRCQARTDGPRNGWLKKLTLLSREYYYDAKRFIAHSGALSPRHLATLRALVTMDTHRVEKGLAIPSPKPWFGESIIQRVLHNTSLYARLGGDEDVCKAALDAVEGYLDANSQHAAAEPQWVPELTRTVAGLNEQLRPAGLLGGTKAVSRETIYKASRLDSLDFFTSRYSIRDFAADPVTEEQIAAAVTAAQHTPSVCNRQSWSVNVFPRGPHADAVLACQNGNAGFGHTASHILLITVDLRTFVYPGERNQGWVDGGMFAMSLLHAFHALGIGTCCLNWSVDSQADRRLRAVAEISSHEIVIMMLAVGQLPENLRVATSWRRPLDDVIRTGRLRQFTIQGGDQ
ncbi:nitroreductase family protein [Streptomyces sp. NPDC051243]|uniref:nitroreductase family protein n=1 Tax=Streptomyces sp. NPDC051243 TaxID=3365646 RepID=UPI00379F2395